VVARGLRRVDGAVVGDESLFDAQRGAFGPIERALDGSLSALAYNRGRSGDFSPVVEAPAIAAAAVFNDLLEARSVTIGGTPRTGAMAGPGSVELGAVRTTTRELARIMLREDDHFVAEMLGKRLAAAVSIPATTAHATELLQRAAGSPARFHDTAGVHPRNRATPSQVGSVLRGLNRRGDRTLLPMLGTRSVQDRGISALARKRCRAVSTPGTGANIAGLCVTRRGGMVAFAILGGTKARRAADRMVAAIARR
jgi:D-alanyl-D-alanine carboxypeptidase